MFEMKINKILSIFYLTIIQLQLYVHPYYNLNKLIINQKIDLHLDNLKSLILKFRLAIISFNLIHLFI